MSETKGWSEYLNSYYGTSTKKQSEPFGMDYSKFSEMYYGKQKDTADTTETTEDPNMPSHITDDEQYENFVNEHIIEDNEQFIDTVQDVYEDAIAATGPIELGETTETHLENGPSLRPVEEPDFTMEELEEFKALNADKFIHETNEVDQPIETKVTKVKVSKPKASKKAGRSKPKK